MNMMSKIDDAQTEKSDRLGFLSPTIAPQCDNPNLEEKIQSRLTATNAHSSSQDTKGEPSVNRLPPIDSCPAAGMAALVGNYNKQYVKFDELRTQHRPKEGKFSEIYRDFDNACTAAYTFEQAARQALVIAPVCSIQGAVAKIIMAIEFLQEERDNELDEYEIKKLRRSVDIMIEHAVDYFAREHNSSPEAIGLSGYYSEYLYPLFRLERGIATSVRQKPRKKRT